MSSSIPDPIARAGRRPARTWFGRPLLGALLAALVAGFLIALHAPLFEPGQLHLGPGFVDQTAYVTTARRLAQDGELASGIVYPAHIEHERWRPYMPGHYLALASSYRLLGYGAFNSILPNLLALLLGAVCVFVLARHLYSPAGGLAACIILVLFPQQLTYAHTAMAETTFLAAGILAFTVFYFLPRSLRAYFGPFLLLLPFAFRETGALYVIPMAWIVARGTRRWARPLAFLLLGSVLLCVAAQRFEVSRGKGSLPLAWVSGESFNYRDATAMPIELAPWDWLAGAWHNTGRNLGTLGERLVTDLAQPGLLGFFVLVLAATWIGVRGWRLRTRDEFPLAAALLALAAIAVVVVLYDVKAQKALRTALFTTPLLAVPLGGWGAARLASWWQGAARARMAAFGVLSALAAGHGLLVSASATELKASDENNRRGARLIEGIGHGPGTLLIAPHDMFATYAIEHFPSRCAFIPANDATLTLMASRFTLGTLILPSVYVGDWLSEEALRRASLGLVRETPGGDFRIYRRQP